MCINHGRHGVGRVTEPIDELKTEGDQQRAAQQDERAHRCSLLDRKLGNQMTPYLDHTRGENQSQDNNTARTWASGEFFVNRTLYPNCILDGRCHSGLTHPSK